MLQLLCTSNSKLKGPETKKTKKKKKQTQLPSCSSHLHKGTEDMREQNTKALEKSKNYEMIPIPVPSL